MSKSFLPIDYQQTLTVILDLVHQARYASFKAVNTHLIQLYWEIGRIISEKQEKSQWGDHIIPNLAKDLENEFAGVRGFSARNLLRMRTFYEIYTHNAISPTLLAKLPWSHHGLILEKVKLIEARTFYIEQAIQQSWSFRYLEKKIRDQEFENFKLNQTNFVQVLAQEAAETALLAVKDHYNLDFLELTDKHKERALEDGIVHNIVNFLSEMGGVFAFIGRQVKLVLNEREYFIDLLFYHRILKCLIVVELKSVEFEPEHAGKMQFYLTMADKTLRQEGENPSIGIILCKHKDRTLVEYTLQDVSRPVGVATYSYKELPEAIAKYLPTDEVLNFDL